MFRHWLDRPQNKIKNIRSTLHEWGQSLDWEDIFVFIHITLAFLFVVWGLEIILPWSIWRILIGLYLFLWVGIDLVKQLWGRGIYFLSGDIPEVDIVEEEE